MKLAVVGDEIGTSIQEQIESLKKANISNIELRKVDDKYLWEFSKEELKSINMKSLITTAFCLTLLTTMCYI